MGKVVIDSTCIEDAIKELKVLREECESNRGKKAPKNDKDSCGEVYLELKKIRETITMTWDSLIALIDQTILFLGGIKDSTTKSDQQSANAIKI